MQGHLDGWWMAPLVLMHRTLYTPLPQGGPTSAAAGVGAVDCTVVELEDDLVRCYCGATVAAKTKAQGSYAVSHTEIRYRIVCDQRPQRLLKKCLKIVLLLWAIQANCCMNVE